jgi:glycogen operon protein
MSARGPQIAQAPSRAPAQLGASLCAGGAQFAVLSHHARAIDVCLFEPGGAREIARWRLSGREGDVRFGFVPGVRAGQLYGLRAHGEWAPAQGLRFDPAKLLVDPYATRLDRPFVFDEAMTRQGAETGALTPRCVVEAREDAGEAALVSARAPAFVYEMNVRAWTMLDEAAPQELRGTLAALAQPSSIARLQRLGVSHVELMPLHAWIDEPHLARLGLRNAWGYNPVSFLALDPRLAPGGWADLRAVCARLREAGVGVIVDVVFNHTGEGDALGPTLSLRGLDEALYYRRLHDGALANEAGCGNTLACARAPVVRLAMDALRKLAHAGVEGFRFDLATTLGRGPEGFSPEAPLLAAIAQDPLLRERLLIAEPWDIGPGGYRLGAFSAPFLEWNDRYRDDVRRFWRGDGGALGPFATRIAGSQDVFGPRHRPPSASVDFICAHDGFTLRDLVSHAAKRNLANGEEDRDGADENFSWNCGLDGPADAQTEALRGRDMRALLATLFLSRGTPMLTAGDECGRTQGGNNNAYCQDNETIWLDWARADMELFDYVARLARLRARFPHWRDAHLEADGPGAQGVRARWLRADGADMSAQDWGEGDRLALLCACGAGIEEERILIVFHRGHGPLAFQAPPPRPGFRWVVALDSANPRQGEAPAPFAGMVGARSVLLIVERPLA